MTTRELHELIAPVIPHAGTDPELPELGVIRLEVRDDVLYAVATDRYTMAATRRPTDDPADDVVVGIDGTKARDLLVTPDQLDDVLAALKNGEIVPAEGGPS